MSSTFLDQQGLVKSIYYSILFIKLNPSVVVKNKESLNAVKVSLKPDFFCTKDVSDIVSLVFFMVACIKVIFNFQKKRENFT